MKCDKKLLFVVFFLKGKKRGEKEEKNSSEAMSTMLPSLVAHADGHDA